MSYNDLTLVNLDATILGSSAVLATFPSLPTTEPFLSNGPDAYSTAVPENMRVLYNQFIAQARYSYRM